MKAFLLVVALFTFAMGANASECSDVYSRKTFSSTTYSKSSCDLYATEKLALNKCINAGFSSCYVIISEKTVDYTDGGDMEVCSVTTIGQKVIGRECL